MQPRKLVTLGFAIFLCAALRVGAQNVNGLVLTVNSNLDTHDANLGDRVCADLNGQCTLRAAIEEANSNSTRDAILFSLPQPSVIDLTIGELLISQSLDILGPGARRLTVQRSFAAGTSNFHVFHISPAPIAVVNIRSVTMQNGNDLFGGGMQVEPGGVVGLFDSVVTGNHGQLGGGIMSSGRLTILRCLIASNTAQSTGGGIVNVNGEHDLTLVSSTVTGNSTANVGGIYNEGTMLLINDTISGNAATTSVSSILTSPSGTAKVMNTIIGRDTGQTVNALRGPFQSAGNNIVTNSTGSTGFTNGVNGDQVSENNAIDPMLGPLANNGGQSDTLALLPGSPAILGGNVCVTTGQCPQLPTITFRGGRFDQRRGRRSPFADKIDIGTYETNTLNGGGILSLSFGGVGGGAPAARFAGALASLTHPATMEKRYTLVRLNGDVVFTNLPDADAYVFEIRSKRQGALTPLVFAFD